MSNDEQPVEGEPVESEPVEGELVDAACVERDLDALEAAGARGYDAPACDCVRALLTRAEELGGPVGERLIDRAHAHVKSLSERFAKDRTRTLQKLESLEAVHGPQPELRKVLERGEITRVGRAVRKLSGRPVLKRIAIQSAGALPIEPPVAWPRAQRLAARRKQAVVYEDSVAALVASFALARAVDVVPADAGPYNPLRIASETLDRMREISPFYLTVQLNRLEELASLLALPELPAPPTDKALPRKKRGVLKG